MSSLITELAATCNALGSLDKITGKYFLDEYTIDTVKDLIRYLRRDDEDHEIRRHLGQTRVLETDLVPILINHSENIELFDVTLRLVVNLTNPPLLLYREEMPTEKHGRRCYLEMISQLQTYKTNTFTGSDIWTVLGKRLTKILELDQYERTEELSLIIERILILIRNVLHIPPDESELRRPNNDASVHDQVLWALNQSGLLDIILYMSSESDKQYYMHIIEIISLALREQNPSSLADAALHRSTEEKLRDEQELRIIRENEVANKKEKNKFYSANRHSRFGGTFIVKDMKSISDNNLICHKPLSSLTNLDFDIHKHKLKTPKNRRPEEDFLNVERRSAFAIRLFLKEFCIEFLNGSYNPLMHFVRDALMRSKAQKNDETYYMWAIKFFMEFNRKHNFDVKYVSETMSVSTFHYVQQQMERCFEMIISDKKSISLWVKRLHLSLRAYQELFQTLSAMDRSPDQSVQDSSKVIKSNIFYVLEYREFILHLMLTYDETKMPKLYLKDLIETAHTFLKMLESFCRSSSLIVQNKVRTKSKKATKKATKTTKPQNTTIDKDMRWDEVAGQLSVVLQSDVIISTNIMPFDATLETGIDEQKSDCMKKIQKLLLDFRFEDAVSLIRAAREVWPENDVFGANSLKPEEEFEVMRTIFLADIGGEAVELTQRPPPDEDDERDEEGDNENYDDNEEEDKEETAHIAEADFSFVDFINRFVNPKITKALCLCLAQFEKNSIFTNHCVIKFMHRIAWDCKYPTMFFQASLFRTFQRILASKSDLHKELKKFAIFIVRKFTEVAKKNPKVFMELLFWKNTREAYEIENGYEGESHKKTKASSWTEEQENELRVLYMENQSNPTTEKDVIDWIQEMMIDQTKTRRAIIKKLKELGLIFKAPTKKSTHRASMAAKERAPIEFTPEEDEALKNLWEEFSNSIDPMGMIIIKMPMKRPKRCLIDRLMELGIVKDKKECRKKRQKKKTAGKSDEGSDNRVDSDSDSTGSEKSDSSKKKNKQKKRKQTKKNERSNFTDIEIIKSLTKTVDAGFTDSLKWVIESLEEVALDQEAEGFDAEAVAIPLVPLQDEYVMAMESDVFLATLRCIGIEPPDNEQETYWRIPGNIHFSSLRKRCEMINKAIDKSLIIPSLENDNENENNGNSIENDVRPQNINGKIQSDSSSDEDIDDFFKRINNVTQDFQTADTSKKKEKSYKRKKIQHVESSESSDTESNRITFVRKKSKTSVEDDIEQSNFKNEKSSNFSEVEDDSASKNKPLNTSTIRFDDSDSEIESYPSTSRSSEPKIKRKNVISSDESDE